MPERPGPWELLDHSSDPVVADLAAADDRTRYLSGLAEAMRTEGRRLARIASGESLKGRYADELRSGAEAVGKDLDQVVGRYEAVVQALKGFRPALEVALSGSAQALDDAIDAAAASRGADAMPLTTAADGDGLTAEQEQANADKTAATAAAADRVRAAKERLSGVLAALDDAGRQAADTIRKSFDDGLTDSGWDRFKYAFKKFLKILVKVLTYVGMALAAIAILIPGVGQIVLAAGVAIGAAVLVADIGLMAMGEGSWLDIGMDLFGLVTFGAGKVLGPAVKSVGNAFKGGSKGIVKGADGAVSKAAGSKGAPKSNTEACTNGDPVDVATGDVLTFATDLALPGVLPLVIERTHRSSWRVGRAFGPGWMSSLDQRLELGDGVVHGLFADGRIVTWPLPEGDDGVRPLSGPRWMLRRISSETFEVHDRQRGLTWRYAQRADEAESFPLQVVSDRAGHAVTFHYDADGLPKAVTDAAGYRVEVAVAGGRVSALTVAGESEPLRTFTYDEAGNLIDVVNASGRPLTYSYDTEGRLTGWVDRNGQFYRYTFDDLGRCVRGEGPDGALSGTFEYEQGRTRWVDAAGAETLYEFTESGLLAAETDALGNTTRHEYDVVGDVVADIDALGRVQRYARNEFGDLVGILRPDGGPTHLEYDERGLAVTLTAPDRSMWRQEFDENANLIASTDPVGATTRFEYDEGGHLARITEADGSVTKLTVDARGFAREITAPDGGRTSFETDTMGRVTRVTMPDGRVTSLVWTRESELASRLLPDGASESFEWDAEGNLIRYVDAAGAVTTYEYGPFNVLVAEVDPDGTRTQFARDHAQRTTSISRGGPTWSYEYDAAGRITAETDYNGATISYAYDAAGQLIRQVNASGQAIEYVYNLLGDMIKRDVDGAVAEFEYDVSGNMVRASTDGADVRFDRDVRGRVVSESVNGRTVATTFDDSDRVVARETPSGLRSEWEFDAQGRPVGVTAAGRRLGFGYDAAGRETRRELPGGVALTQDWDPRGRPASQAVVGVAGPVQQRAYGYREDGFPVRIEDLLAGNRTLTLDPVGRVTSVRGGAWEERYEYDQVGTVVGAAGSLPRGLESALPEPPSDEARMVEARRLDRGRVVGAGRVRYSYDAVGRVITRSRTRLSRKPDIWHYEWDGENRLVSVSTPAGDTWRYRYDALGRRIAKQRYGVDGRLLGETSFTWDDTLLVEQVETDGDSRRVTTWDYAPGSFAPILQTELVALRDAPDDEIERRFYSIVADIAGAPSELIGEDGGLAGTQRRTLLGATAWREGGASTPLRFPGQYADDETGLHYNFERYYDPAVGSYLTPDPLGMEGGGNPYAYVDNPFTMIDPYGLSSCASTSAPSDVPTRNTSRPPKVARPTPADEVPSTRGPAGKKKPYIGDEIKGGSGWLNDPHLTDLTSTMKEIAMKEFKSSTAHRTYAAVFDKKTGKAVIASSGGGYCAEGNALKKLRELGGGNLDDIVFTKAITVVKSPDGGSLVINEKPVCSYCQNDYPNKSNFVPGIEGDKGWLWDKMEKEAEDAMKAVAGQSGTETQAVKETVSA